MILKQIDIQITFKNIYFGYWDWENTERLFTISFPRENKVGKHDLAEFKVQYLKAFVAMAQFYHFAFLIQFSEQFLKFLVYFHLFEMGYSIKYRLPPPLPSWEMLL